MAKLVVTAQVSGTTITDVPVQHAWTFSPVNED
jgi:hypothetical protein